MGELERQREVVKTVLQEYLGYSSVEVQSIVMKSRRLQESSAGGYERIEISFSTSVSKWIADDGKLAEKLQIGFDEAGGRVAVELAAIEWEPVPAQPTTKGIDKT